MGSVGRGAEELQEEEACDLVADGSSVSVKATCSHGDANQ